MSPPELSYQVHINSLGLRGPEIERSAPPGRIRILVLGDSMMFGYYLEEVETFPARLEARLRADGIDTEVVNTGSGGWSIASETSFLIERGLALEPDHVILAISGNDLTELGRDESMYLHQKRAVGELGRELSQIMYSTASYELYLRAQVAWKHWRKMRGDRRAPPGALQESSDEVWASYAAWLDRLHETLDARGIRLWMVFVPGMEEVIRGELPTIEARLHELARARGIGFVATLAEFQRDPQADPREWYLLPLDNHFSAAGADRLAGIVEPALAKQLARE
jgi:lysophospholipase L1-like esterase